MDERQRLIRQFHVETARILLRGPETSEGFQIPVDHHRRGDSVEAGVLNPGYNVVFSDEARAGARRRLEAHGFNVDTYLRSPSDGAGGVS
jgi:hypothetical protein